MRLIMLIALATMAGAAPDTVAQTRLPETPRETQARQLDYQRKLLLAMVDSMPERLYRDRATPPQRDFAQQVHHAANSAVYVSSTTMKGPKPSLPDTAAAFSSKAGLRQLVNAAFDYGTKLHGSQNAQARAQMVDLFGTSMPAAQVWDEIYTHTIWTAGQIVANFRKNAMAPPAFTFF